MFGSTRCQGRSPEDKTSSEPRAAGRLSRKCPRDPSPPRVREALFRVPSRVSRREQPSAWLSPGIRVIRVVQDRRDPRRSGVLHRGDCLRGNRRNRGRPWPRPQKMRRVRPLREDEGFVREGQWPRCLGPTREIYGRGSKPVLPPASYSALSQKSALRRRSMNRPLRDSGSSRIEACVWRSNNTRSRERRLSHKV